MYTKRTARFRKLLFSFVLGLLVMGLLSTGSGSSIARAQEAVPSQYDTASVVGGKLQSIVESSAGTITLPDGSVIQKFIADGPPKPPPGFEMQRKPVTLPKSNGRTANAVETAVGGGGPGAAPAYVAGCAATSAGDIAGFYDRGEYPNLYNGPTNGGVMPVDNSLWPGWTDVAGDTYSNNPLIASHMGVDGRTTRGTIDDYWVSYFSGQPDPYINHWPEHAWGDAVADYMYTSQSKYGNDDGATAFYTYLQGAAPLTCDTMANMSLADGALGLRNFYNARGYAVTTCYNQPTDNYRAGGFTFAQLKAEIDAGRPPIIGIWSPTVGGHTVVAVGYDSSTNLVYIHDGWDFATHSMTWGGSYAGMTMQTMTVVNLAPPVDIVISGNAGMAGATLTYTDVVQKTVVTDASGNYSISVPSGWSGTIVPSKTGYTFSPSSISYTNAKSNQPGQNFIASWVGGVKVESNRNVVTVGRPHVGAEVASYDGFSSGSLTAYVPMLFKKAYGTYNSALYVQNVHASNDASITVKYYDDQGSLKCTKVDSIAPLSSKGYWLPTETCDAGSLLDGFVGGAVVTSNQPIVAVGRPHVGGEVMTYNGFTGGSLATYIPMLFKGAYGSYNSAFYIQNVHASNTANITIQYYDSAGNLNCTKGDTIAPLASKGYWVPSATCDTGTLPAGWIGGVVVTSDQPIVGVGRPHIGTQVTTYDGFTAGGLSSYVPMLFKGAYGSYNSAFYLQNTDDTNTATVTMKYYSSSGTLDCTRTETIAPLASKGYWLPSATCDTGSLPAGWIGGVVVTSDQPVVGVGRPHVGEQVTTYNGFTAGNINSYLPMLFKDAFGGSYDSAFYVQNTENTAATVTVKLYDTNGSLACTRTDSIPALSTLGYWVPSIACNP